MLILGDLLVYVHLLIKESPTSTKLISMNFGSVRKHGLHVSSTFNTGVDGVSVCGGCVRSPGPRSERRHMQVL